MTPRLPLKTRKPHKAQALRALRKAGLMPPNRDLPKEVRPHQTPTQARFFSEPAKTTKLKSLRHGHAAARYAPAHPYLKRRHEGVEVG